MQKTASKNIISSGSYEFLLIWPTIQLLYSIHVQTSNRDISKQL